MRRKPIDWTRARIFVVFILLFLCFPLIFLRIIQLQLVKKDELSRLASKQHQSIITFTPKRGTIYDFKGKILAESIDVNSVYAKPPDVKNPSQTAKKLAEILDLDRGALKRKLKTKKSFVWVKRKVTPKKTARIKKSRLEGIHFVRESRRFYPHSHLAAHLVGFVGIDSKGLEGIEAKYDAPLSGTTTRLILGRDAFGREIITEVPIPGESPQNYNIHLTIDINIQYTVEKELKAAVEGVGAKKGMAVVMDPTSGKVLAMANYPSFNPNRFWDTPPDTWRNRVVTDIFEPGSIFKVFLASAALGEKVAKRHDIFFCENGAYVLSGKIIRDVKKYGWLSLDHIIKYSSNIGATKIAERVGREKFYHYIREFGFGTKTGIDLPGEARGIVRRPKTWSKVALGNIAFGQGVAVTSIQLVTAISAIANGGNLLRPYVVDKILDSKGKIISQSHPVIIRRVLSEEVAKTMTSILTGVLREGGTGARGALSYYEAAGKTGTAQKVDSLGGGYYEDRFISSFVGYVPTKQPRLVILVVIDEPQGIPYGGRVAGPVFKNIAERSLQYLNIPATKGPILAKASTRKISGRPPKRTIREAMHRGIPSRRMPDLRGLSIRSALNRVRALELLVAVSGSGRVVDQRPTPGTAVGKGDACFLTFRPDF
ncbi:MAG: penicillin-binding protein [Thermodesulfobacteriota bacterium]